MRIQTIVIVSVSVVHALWNTAENILAGILEPDSSRYGTFLFAIGLAMSRNAKVIVETGTMRHELAYCESDGCSTILLSRLADRSADCRLFSVDIDERATIQASLTTKDFPNTQIVQSCSIAYLTDFPTAIDFLYLDSYDYTYASANACQVHHLREILAAYDKLHKYSIILLDDCSLPFGGKCKMVEEFLLQMGWIKVMSQYQMLFVSGPKTQYHMRLTVV